MPSRSHGRERTPAITIVGPAYSALPEHGSTLPILLLGGPGRESPAATLKDFASGLEAGANVRGAIIGRNLLFPGDADPLPMCRALTALVHRDVGLDGALRVLEE